MLEKLGKRKYTLPFGVLLLIACVFSIMFYPMVHMELKDLPFGIVSFDKGVETSEGEVNIGSLIVENIPQQDSKSEDEIPLSWEKFDSQEALDRALSNNEIYGAIVVPTDFSQSQYDQLVDAMQEQIDSIQENMSGMMPDSSSVSGAVFPNGAGLTSSAASETPSLSDEAQEMIAAAQQNAQGSAEGAASSAQAFQDAQVNMMSLQDQFQKAQALYLDTEESLSAAYTQQETLEKEIEQGSASGEDITDKQTQLEQLNAEIAEAESVLDETKVQLESLQADIQTATKNAENAQANLVNAQTNAKTAMANAAGVQRTATAFAMLESKAEMLTNAIATLKESLGSLNSGNLMSQMSDQFSDMGETAAAKSFSAIADTLEAGTSDEAEADSVATITVYLNMGKNPMIANTLQATLKALFAEAGFSVEIIMLNEGVMAGDANGSAFSSPMSTIMSQQIVLIPVVVVSCVAGLLICRIIKAASKPTKKERFIQCVKQVLFCGVFSLLASLTAFAMLLWVAGIPAPAFDAILFMWLVSYALVTLIAGLGSISFGLGILGLVCVVPFGMMLGVLPYEVLPVFWQDCVYPWAPQRFFGEGLRSILFMGQGAWNNSSPIFAGVAASGVVLGLLSVLKPTGYKSSDSGRLAAFRTRISEKCK